MDWDKGLKIFPSGRDRRKKSSSVKKASLSVAAAQRLGDEHPKSVVEEDEKA